MIIILFFSSPSFCSHPPIAECYLSHGDNRDSLTPVPLCHWISCWLQPSIPTSTQSFVLCPQRGKKKKKSWGSDEKRKGKIDQGPGEQKKRKEKTMPLNVSYATIALLQIASHFHWRQRSSAHRSGYSCLETIAGVLLRQLLSCCGADAFFSLSPINLTPTPPHSSFVPALARQFLNGTRRASIVLLTHSEDGGDFSAEARRPNQGLITNEVGSAWGGRGIGGEHTTAVWEEPLFFLQRQLYFRVCKKQDEDLKYFFLFKTELQRGERGKKRPSVSDSYPWLLWSLDEPEPANVSRIKTKPDRHTQEFCHSMCHPFC